VGCLVVGKQGDENAMAQHILDSGGFRSKTFWNLAPHCSCKKLRGTEFSLLGFTANKQTIRLKDFQHIPASSSQRWSS